MTHPGKSADMSGCALPLPCQYTHWTTHVRSNHCFQTIGTYRNWSSYEQPGNGHTTRRKEFASNYDNWKIIVTVPLCQYHAYFIIRIVFILGIVEMSLQLSDQPAYGKWKIEVNGWVNKDIYLYWLLKLKFFFLKAAKYNYCYPLSIIDIDWMLKFVFVVGDII